MVVHSVLPESLTRAVAEVLAPAGVDHVVHGDADPVGAAVAVTRDDDAIALIGPFRSADVAEAVEVTAPAGLPLLAPVATAAAVTRDDEPGCDDPARHRGTVLRMVARDTVVAQRLAADLTASGLRAFVVAGEHEYGVQLDGQLRLAGLPRTEDPGSADLVVVAGLAGQPEVERAAALGGLPWIAFDGIQGADLATARDVRLALPFSPDAQQADGRIGLEGCARRAAELVVAAIQAGAGDRAEMLDALRSLGPFDPHGDPIDPAVWLWRADAQWRLTPDRPLPAVPSVPGPGP
jgi:hypothetical protein